MLFSSKYPLQQWHFKNQNCTVKIQLLEESVKKILLPLGGSILLQIHLMHNLVF